MRDDGSVQEVWDWVEAVNVLFLNQLPPEPIPPAMVSLHVLVPLHLFCFFALVVDFLKVVARDIAETSVPFNQNTPQSVVLIFTVVIFFITV
jgi:hypothetical protein